VYQNFVAVGAELARPVGRVRLAARGARLVVAPLLGADGD